MPRLGGTVACRVLKKYAKFGFKWSKVKVTVTRLIKLSFF